MNRLISFVPNDKMVSNAVLTPIGDATVANILEAVNNLPVIKEEDMKFLQEKAEHLGKVMECTYMWRTDLQKLSIINDVDFPTVHSKFHQAILEQKVQFDNSMYLAKDYEALKLDMGLIECDIEDIEEELLYLKPTTKSSEIRIKRLNIEIEKKKLDLSFKRYNLEQMRIAMDYRMSEVKGWQVIEEGLIEQMKTVNMSDEEIWSKSTEELKGSFLHAMSKLQAIGGNNLSSAEYNNIVAAAVHVYTQARNAGKLSEFYAECNPLQKDSIEWLKTNFTERKPE